MNNHLQSEPIVTEEITPSQDFTSALYQKPKTTLFLEQVDIIRGGAANALESNAGVILS